MIADSVESIFVSTRGVGLLEPFVQFQIEDLETQFLRSANLTNAPRKARRVLQVGVHHQPYRF